MYRGREVELILGIEIVFESMMLGSERIVEIKMDSIFDDEIFEDSDDSYRRKQRRLKHELKFNPQDLLDSRDGSGKYVVNGKRDPKPRNGQSRPQLDFETDLTSYKITYEHTPQISPPRNLFMSLKRK